MKVELFLKALLGVIVVAGVCELVGLARPHMAYSDALLLGGITAHSLAMVIGLVLMFSCWSDD